MPRIRTVKPEFWEDETIATLTRDARLLFIATLNMADDEGLLRWTPEYIKAQAFMYDDDLTTADVEKLMHELAEAELVLPYRAGRPQRQLAWIVNFRRHQNINRPQPSKLPPPSIQSGEVWVAYKRRDRMTCHLCGGIVSERHDEQKLWPSLDHVIPRSKGGSDYPSNIKLSHVTCNKARRDRDPGVSPSQHAPVTDLPYGSSLSNSLNDSVNDSGDLPHGSLIDSPLEREGEQGREQGAGSRDAPPGSARDPRRQIPDAEGLHEIPDDFAPTDAMLAWADREYPGLDLAEETAQFCRHWRGEGRRKKSWPDAWQKWIADSHKRKHLPNVRAPASGTSRHQQETDEMFSRAMERAKVREAREAAANAPHGNGDVHPLPAGDLPSPED